MKDEELKIEEIEVSHTLGGVGRSYTVVIHTQIRQSHGLGQTIPVWVTKTDAPEYMCYRGKGGRGECGLRRVISTVIHTQICQSRGLIQTMSV